MLLPENHSEIKHIHGRTLLTETNFCLEQWDEINGFEKCSELGQSSLLRVGHMLGTELGQLFEGGVDIAYTYPA